MSEPSLTVSDAGFGIACRPWHSHPAPDPAKVQERRDALTKRLGEDPTRGSRFIPRVEGETRLYFHYYPGTTVTLRYYRDKRIDGFQGEAYVEYWSDRSLRIDASLPERPPDATAIFDFTNNTSTLEGRIKLLDGVYSQMCMGRGVPPTDLPVFQKRFVPSGVINDGMGTGGLAMLDPFPVVAAGSHGADPFLVAVIQTIEKTFRESPKHHCSINVEVGWFFPIVRGVYGGGRETTGNLAAAHSIFQGLRRIQLTKILPSMDSPATRETGHFHELVIWSDEGGGICQAFAKPQTAIASPDHVEKCKFSWDPRSAIGFLYYRDNEEAKIRFRNATALVRAFVMDHAYAVPDERLFATSKLVDEVFEMASLPFVLQHDYEVEPPRSLSIANARLRGLRGRHLNISGTGMGNPGGLFCSEGGMFFSEIEDSDLTLHANESFLWGCHVSNSVLRFARRDNGAVKGMEIKDGKWNSSVEMLGAIESGALSVKGFKANTRGMKKFGLTNEKRGWFG